MTDYDKVHELAQSIAACVALKDLDRVVLEWRGSMADRPRLLILRQPFLASLLKWAADELADELKREVTSR